LIKQNSDPAIKKARLLDRLFTVDEQNYSLGVSVGVTTGSTTMGSVTRACFLGWGLTTFLALAFFLTGLLKF